MLGSVLKFAHLATACWLRSASFRLLDVARVCLGGARCRPGSASPVSVRVRGQVLAARLVALSVLVGTLQDACVIAQPTGDLPRLPNGRPTIVHPSVVPSTSAVLTRFPKVFIVPVELADPTAPFDYAAFVDYNPYSGEGLVDTVKTSTFDVSNTTERTRNLEILIPEPLEPGRCHIIEVVVALHLYQKELGRGAHTPDEPPGGDLVTWFYNPSGDLDGCPTLDAGLSPDVDAGEDGSP